MSVPAGLSINEPPLRRGGSAGDVAQCLPGVCEALGSIPAPQTLAVVEEDSYNPSTRETEDEMPTDSLSYTSNSKANLGYRSSAWVGGRWGAELSLCPLGMPPGE